jgi:hypothetical protein
MIKLLIGRLYSITWISSSSECYRQVFVIQIVLNVTKFVMNSYEILLFNLCTHLNSRKHFYM